MAMVRAVPEVHLVLDPITGFLARERNDVLMYELEPVIDKLNEVEAIADDLVNSLAPDAPLLNSWPGREKTSWYEGILTNSFYGFIFGLLVSFVVIVVLYYTARVVVVGGV
ncbi:MAG: tetrahydromethanopterin S-methyltransferase subunit B [Methermicoccaceae archaeon]